MNDYEAKQEARRERLETAAGRTRAQAAADFDSGHAMLERIPLGQPILVGHHSEGRDRRYRARADGKMRKAFDGQRRADDLQRRADAVGTGGVSSDDPDAIAKLKAKLFEEEANHARMVSANKLVRRRDRAGLVAMGFGPSMVESLLTPDDFGHLGFPSYQLTNSKGRIRKTRERLEGLLAAQADSPRETVEGDGWRIVDDKDENRIRVEFDSKPAKPVREKLSASGFRFSPSRGAWVRKRSNRSYWAAKNAMGAQ